MVEKLNLEEFLSQEFGLSRNEIDLYLVLLKHGPSTVLEASKLANMNRATVHMNVGYLSQKGFINEVKKGRGSRRVIMPEPPEKLAAIIRTKKARLEEAEKQLPAIIQELSGLKTLLKNQRDDTEIRYYQGKEEVKFIYDEALKAKEFRAYVSTEKINDIFPSNIGDFAEMHARRKDMQIWEIVKESASSLEYVKRMGKRERFECRVIPKEAVLEIPDIDYMLFDGKVAVVDFEKGVKGILITNNTYYQNAVALYKFIWQAIGQYKK